MDGTEAAAAESPSVGEGEDRDSILRQMLEDAANYNDSVLSPERQLATDYYFGRPFGNESDGRSRVVVTDVRDTVEQTIPSLMRVFTGPERVVEFRPKDAEGVPLAEEATDYIQHAFMVESGGFLRTLDVLKDGFVRKLGIFKWSWDDRSATKNYELENVAESQLQMLMQDEDVSITNLQPASTPPQIDAESPQEPLYHVKLSHRTSDGCARIDAVPPEEFLYNRSARSMADAVLIAHRTRKTRGELIEMGVKEKDIDEHGGPDPQLDDNVAAQARDPEQQPSGTEEEQGEANQGILYVESYVRMDEDGDGIAELRRICTIGPQYHVVSDEVTNEIPFATFCPIPEPHTMTGQSLADLTMDLQKTKSALVRGVLDSLAASIFPRTWYKETDANVQDVMNTEIGAPIRTRSGGNAVGVFAHPFVGKEAMPVLQYFDEIKEGRVGRAGGADGLHMDSMQSSTKGAVAAAVSDANLRTEMFARVFAEMTLAPLFRGLLRLYVQHKPKPRSVNLNGEWRMIDPSVWDADMEVTVNVALGAGLTEDKIAMYEAIIAKQEQLMQLLGPQNPLVDLVGYRTAIAEAMKLRGRKDVDRFFKPFGQKEQQEMEQRIANAPKQPDQETPEQTIAKATIEVERMKAEREMSIKEAELALKDKELAQKEAHDRRQQALEHERAMYIAKLQDDRERDAAAADQTLRRMEIDAKYQAAVTAAQLKQETEMERNSVMAGPESE